MKIIITRGFVIFGWHSPHICFFCALKFWKQLLPVLQFNFSTFLYVSIKSNCFPIVSTELFLILASPKSFQPVILQPETKTEMNLSECPVSNLSENNFFWFQLIQVFFAFQQKTFNFKEEFEFQSTRSDLDSIGLYQNVFAHRQSVKNCY